jgi:hypothetical protein
MSEQALVGSGVCFFGLKGLGPRSVGPAAPGRETRVHRVRKMSNAWFLARIVVIDVLLSLKLAAILE